jgi:hypothetical protein
MATPAAKAAAILATGFRIAGAGRGLATILATSCICHAQKSRHRSVPAIIDELGHADPVHRRELLSKMETCPCCDRWLGHNRPPADIIADDPPYRRQPSFDFDRS